MFGRRPTFTMNEILPRLREVCWSRALTGAAAVLLLGAVCAGAQTLPPTPPTSLTSPNSFPAPIAATSAATPGSNLQYHKASVTYANGLLDVQADNSSLNQILRDISHETGMIVVGGVADQRIFGKYGPAPPAAVLQTLIEGTGSNMLIKETATHGVAQLVLTPLNGGATPPGPNSPIYDATENEPGLPHQGPMAEPRSALPRPEAAASPNPTATRPVSPNKDPHAQLNAAKVKTPQQIFEELQEMQKRQAAAAQGAAIPK